MVSSSTMRSRFACLFVAIAAGCGSGADADSSSTGAGGNGDTAGTESAAGGDRAATAGAGGEGAATATPSSGDATASTAAGTGANSQGGGASGTGGAAGSTAGSGGAGGGEPTPPDIDAIAWETGEDVGFGVARKDTENPLGESAFIGYAGYAIGSEAARTWVTALYRAALRDRGVRYVYAVQGPAQPGYDSAEIGNSKIAAALGEQLSAETGFVLMVGHSSGSFVAHELLRQLEGGLDPSGATAGRVVYFNLDGGLGGLTQPAVDRLRRGYFVGALDGDSGTASPNRGDMMNGGAIYGAAGGYWELDASGSGCAPGATWCVHMTPITTLPHDPGDGSEIDYADFEGRPVTHSFIDAKIDEAGL